MVVFPERGGSHQGKSLHIKKKTGSQTNITICNKQTQEQSLTKTCNKYDVQQLEIVLEPGRFSEYSAALESP